MPTVQARNAPRAHTPAPTLGRRDARRYGTPGISRALTAAGQALDDPRPAQTATTAQADRIADQWDTQGPLHCHGTAGVLQAARSHPATADLATTALTKAFDPRHLFSTSPSGSRPLWTPAPETAWLVLGHNRS
ncbi:lanthionine synthetase LanC family protein [Spirillospora sp. CA-108201]